MAELAVLVAGVAVVTGEPDWTNVAGREASKSVVRRVAPAPGAHTPEHVAVVPGTDDFVPTKATTTRRVHPGGVVTFVAAKIVIPPFQPAVVAHESSSNKAPCTWRYH